MLNIPVQKIRAEVGFPGGRTELIELDITQPAAPQMPADWRWCVYRSEALGVPVMMIPVGKKIVHVKK